MPNETMAEFIEELRKDADAAFPYDVDYMNVVNGIADRVEEVWEREREKTDAMREALEKIARYDDADNMDDPSCADGHICADIARVALGIPEGGAK